jgi:hypothetical protein
MAVMPGRGVIILLAGLLLLPDAVGVQAQQALPPLADTMYDTDRPVVIAPTPWPVLCPPLPPGRTMRPPTRDGRMECPEHYERIAQDVFRVYDTTSDDQVRARCADVLGQLWFARRLPGQIKGRIVERDVVPVLSQVPLADGRLELTVTARSAFPFPPVTFRVSSAVYRNGAVLLSPSNSGGARKMWRDGQLTSLGTGSYVAGDVYSFDIILEEEAGPEIVWRKVLRTNAVRVK